MAQQAQAEGAGMEAIGKGKAAMNEGFGEEGANRVLEEVTGQQGGQGQAA